MTYLIDTDWVIDHLVGDPKAVKLLAKFTEQGLAISKINIFTYFTNKSELARERASLLSASSGDVCSLPATFSLHPL